MASSEVLASEHTEILVFLLETLRVCCAPREENKRPISGNRISGDENSPPNNGATAPTSKGEETLGRSISPPKIDSPTFSEGGIPPAGKDEFSIAGNSTWSLILQNDSHRPSLSFRERSTGLREPLPAVRGSQRGACLVGGTPAALELQKPGSNGARHGVRIGCLSDRLGASCQGTCTGSPWSPEEKLHINCLELMAAFLALRTFLSRKIPTRQREGTVQTEAGTCTGGPWSPKEKFHINCLELMAAFLALRTLLSRQIPTRQREGTVQTEVASRWRQKMTDRRYSSNRSSITSQPHRSSHVSVPTQYFAPYIRH